MADAAIGGTAARQAFRRQSSLDGGIARLSRRCGRAGSRADRHAGPHGLILSLGMVKLAKIASPLSTSPQHVSEIHPNLTSFFRYYQAPSHEEA